MGQEAVDAMMAQYKKNSEKKSFKKKTDFDLRNYFTTFLQPGVDKITKRIRILPPKEAGDSIFQEQFVHAEKIDGQWKKLHCLDKNDGKVCPYCERQAELSATGKEDDLKESYKYFARTMYIIKLVDRDDEEWGPSFWRFVRRGLINVAPSSG